MLIRYEKSSTVCFCSTAFLNLSGFKESFYNSVSM